MDRRVKAGSPVDVAQADVVDMYNFTTMACCNRNEIYCLYYSNDTLSGAFPFCCWFLQSIFLRTQYILCVLRNRVI